MSLTETARTLGVHPATVKNMMLAGSIQGRRETSPGGRVAWVFAASEVARVKAGMG